MSTPEYQNTKNSLTFGYQLKLAAAVQSEARGAWGNKQFALATIEETLRDMPSRMKFKSSKAGRSEVEGSIGKEEGRERGAGKCGVDSTLRGVLMGLLFQRTSD